MTLIKEKRKIMKAAGLSIALLSPLAVGALVYWAHAVESGLKESSKLQSIEHESKTNLINRDIEDLEGQIATKTGQLTVGEFKFYPSEKGLNAKHTALLNQPITISAEEGLAFQKILESSAQSKYIIITKDLAPVSYAKSNRRIAMLAASNAQFVENIRPKPQFLENYDSATLSADYSWRQFVRRPKFTVLSSAVRHSNLVLVSFSPLASLWSQFQKSLFFIAASLFGSFVLLFSFLLAVENKRQASATWLGNVLSKLNSGRLDLGTAKSFSNTDSLIRAKIDASLKNGSALESLFSVDWLDETNRIATWHRFSATLKSWEESTPIDRDEAPRAWFIASAKFSNSTLAKNFCSTLVEANKDSSLQIFFTTEQTLHFILDCNSLNAGILNLTKAKAAFSQVEKLSAHDFAISAYFHGGKTAIKDSKEYLEKSLARANKLFEQNKNNVLPQNIEVISMISDTRLHTDSLSKVTNEKMLAAHETFTNNKRAEKLVATKSTLSQKAPAAANEKKRMPVPKTRLEEKKRAVALPPPPNLQNRIRAKALSESPNGKAFVRVRDALGQKRWVEIGPEAKASDKSV